MSQVKTKKSPTSEERWGFLGLINGGTAHPFKLAFGGEGNGPVTLGNSLTTSTRLVCDVVLVYNLGEEGRQFAFFLVF